MKIAVCVKQVPDTWAEKTLQAGDSTLDREGPEGVMNEIDEYAVEEALQRAIALREKAEAAYQRAATKARRAEALVLQFPEMQTLSWVDERRRIKASHSAPSLVSLAPRLPGEPLHGTEAEAILAFAGDAVTLA